MNSAPENLDLSTFQISENPPKIINYRSFRDASAFFRKTCRDDRGLGLFHAQPLSGKMTAIREFVRKLPEDSPGAIVDGENRDVPSFLLAIANAFGFEVDAVSSNVLLNLIKVFAVQQTRSNNAPLLVVQNLDKMRPEALHVVCQLAQLKVPDQSALRLILVSDRPLSRMISAPQLGAIRARQTGVHELGPMTRAESAYYLDAKLRHAGVKHPETVLRASAADELFERSGGRPGVLDRCIIEELAKDQQAPQVILTRNHETLATVTMEKRRLLIGRAETNDLVIDSTFISRHHIMLTRNGDEIVLTDLNSTNGTCVNSAPVSIYGLRHEDVISLGHYRLKLIDPASVPRSSIAGLDLADTANMQALHDIKRRYARDKSRQVVTSS